MKRSPQFVASPWLGVLLFASVARAEVTLPPVFSDGLVLQAGASVPVWGEDRPGSRVMVELAGQQVATEADSRGQWRAVFPPLAASRQPIQLTVAGSSPSVVRDILVGEVWLASGQSNVAMTIRRSQQEALAAGAPFPADVRFFDGSKWISATPEKLPTFSAVAWAFAREIAPMRDAPVGMIVLAGGGTRIESWMPRAALERTDHGRRMAELADNPDVIAAAAADGRKFRPLTETGLYRWRMGRALPMALYAKLIQPLQDFPIRGVLWYQGESNAMTVDDAVNYHAQLADLVSAWRRQWQRPALPFLVVQLPAYDPKPEEGTVESWDRLRASQQEAVASLQEVALVDIFDLGDPHDIHPRRKYEVGERLAQGARRLVYDRDRLSAP